jgi:hypothetical protein
VWYQVSGAARLITFSISDDMSEGIPHTIACGSPTRRDDENQEHEIADIARAVKLQQQSP